MTKRKRTPRRPTTAGVIGCVVCGVLLAGASYLIEARGGIGAVPSWEQLAAWLGVPVGGPAAADLAEGDATITFFDVGQGDSVLIASGEDTCLIDAGTPDAADSLVAMLLSADVTKLDTMVMTHPHADHLGGMTRVLQSVEVETLVVPPLSAEERASAQVADVLEWADTTDTAVVTAADDLTLSVGDGTLTVLLAGLPDADDANNESLCLRYTLGKFAFLDTGDAEAEAEEALAARCGFGLRCTLFKAGHHGSSTSNTDVLLSLAQPEVAVVSCGKDNEYGHPHAEVLDRFAACGVEVLRTDEQGSITIAAEADGSWRWLGEEAADPAA